MDQQLEKIKEALVYLAQSLDEVSNLQQPFQKYPSYNQGMVNRILDDK